ncbi:AraC family transcriptional regulator [Gimesia chilikensis]|uniref:AraC family transcriptional regulator n=1 Tax=Gimesia chilikensis TaxID=2605989 RepID=UPI00118B9111|nr:AraC family transcriptional regulator [Gimesia chilikensis]QDT88314.1 Right origin-binding protein [Gimesia chilikensis]
MAPVQKALWYVESHSRDVLSLEAVARASCVSPYHLTRSFAEVFGISLMRYTRQRRLSEAAKQLAAGAPDILSIAFDYGYGSHEAFSRAFKKEFGVTPERVRTLADLSQLQLKEPIVMDSTQLPRLNPPREETLPALSFAGLFERYDCQSSAGIPNQWQRASPLLGSISPLVSQDAYGICFNFDETDGKFDYMAGVPVEQGTTLPPGLVRFDLPTHKYAVFQHGGHISEIRSVIAAIWADALSQANQEPISGPVLEKYGPEFDPQTGRGGFEIWIPVK